MKKLWIVPTLAAAAIAAGCGSKPQPPPQPQGQGDGGWQTCTDQQGRVVDERQCDPRAQGYRPGFRWYYYPYGGPIYPIGWGVPLGGSYANEPRPGVATALAPGKVGVGAPAAAGARTGVVRGGFGSTGSGKAAAS